MRISIAWLCIIVGAAFQLIAGLTVLALIYNDINILAAIAALILVPAMPVAGIYYGFVEGIWGPIFNSITGLVFIFIGLSIKQNA